MIELLGVSAGYQSRAVLRDVSLTFRRGEVLALIGPNGCGKSTLLKTADGLLPPLGGQILLDGVPQSALSPQMLARRVAYLAQSRPAPSITAHRMVLHGRFPHLGYPRRYRPEDHAIAQSALQTVDAAALSERMLPELSGGQRQKVFLAAAIAQQTDAVLMDEPTTFLDIANQLAVMRIAHQLASQGKAVVLILHDLPLAMQQADRLAVLAGGRLQQVGPPEEIWQSGVLERVFAVRVQRSRCETGWRYFCDLPD